MKALVLAAGFGTRLAPATDRVPKPLFPVHGVPVLGRMMDRLKRAGCTEAAINTHHLADQIRQYVEQTDFGIPVRLSHEPDILGTGGAIRRLASFWDHNPFIVVNADLVTNIDMAGAYRDHRNSGAAVTLVMHDRAPFNQVWVDGEGQVTGFARFPDERDHAGQSLMAFTGIHVMDPSVIACIPADGFCDIIAVYRQMIDRGQLVHAHVVNGHYWQDMGSPERYRDAVIDAMLTSVHRTAFATDPPTSIRRQPLCGDGSDRHWFRFSCGDQRFVMVDHGITPDIGGSEINAFVRIGRHLHRCGLPVPRIYAHDDFSGLVFLEDLGDVHLQQCVTRGMAEKDREACYRQVIDTWLDLTIMAAESFDPGWTCQSQAYDENLIIEKECRYFVDAFLNGCLQLGADHDDFADEFTRLARETVAAGVDGLIHRDFQSRNIMIHKDRPYLIDFQGARKGPIQYDLAALLIDPYVALVPALQERLLAYAAHLAEIRLKCPQDRFMRGYRYCAVTRNLQMLGAFGYLSTVKGKSGFKRWIPRAAGMLADHVDAIGRTHYPRLHAIARKIGAVC